MTRTGPALSRAGVQLGWRLASTGGGLAAIDTALFVLLEALQEHGSILRAARALGASYRHVWGECRRWERELREPLLCGRQGEPAQLTPLAERLLQAERRARARMAPHVEALRAELERAFTDAHSARTAVQSERPAPRILHRETP